MNYANVKFANEARDKIIEGVNLITDAIKVSYGPNGRQVAIKVGGTLTVTKDGSTIAAAVNDSDPYISMGIDLIKEVSLKTSEEVGDGSSTVAILAREIVNRYKDYHDPVAISRYLDKVSDHVLEEIKKDIIPIVSKEDIKKVATLSANNDDSIGSIIADAYIGVGKDGLVTFEESNNTKDSVEFTNGFRIESGYASPYFINTPKGTCELENVYVYISDVKIEEVKQVMELCEKAMSKKKSLLLIAPGFESECLIFLRANLDVLKSCCILSPNHRNYRLIMVDDIKDILGESSSCQRIICDSKFTTFIGFDSNKDAIDKKISDIHAIVEDGSMNEFDLSFHTKRLAIFTGGIATIKVGGYSTTEIKSKMALYEDAVNSTAQAIKYGVIAGGGKMLQKVADIYTEEDPIAFPFGEVLRCPARILGTTDNTAEEMIANGVLEPYSTCKTTLKNAVSIAGLILTCDCAIINNNF